MKKAIFLMALIGIFVSGMPAKVMAESEGKVSDLLGKNKEVHYEKIKKFVEEFGPFAKKIIDGYKKDVKGIAAKDKAEKYHKMMGKLGEYFRNRDFSLHEWLLIQQEFGKRYKLSKEEHDQLGSEIAFSRVRQNIEKNLPQSFKEISKIIANKTYTNYLRIRYVNYTRELLHEISYYPNRKYKVNINDEVRTKIIDTLVTILIDKTTDTELRSKSVFLLAGYFGDSKKAVNLILNVLDNPDEEEEVKIQAIFGSGSKFGAGKDVRVIAKLIDILNNKSKHSINIINRTIRTLSYLGNKEAINVGIDILNTTDDENLFRETLSSLSKTDNKEAIKAVLKNNSKFGINTLYSLYQKDDILIEIMNTESEEYSISAINALGVNLPKDAAKVVEQLKAGLYSSKPKIRLASARAIKKIGKRGNGELKNEILAAFNKVKKEEKNKEILQEIEDSIKILESEL